MAETTETTIEKEEQTEVIEKKETIKSDYEGMEPGDLIKLLQNRDSRLHTVNEESKSRKLKLREAEQIQEELRTNALKEQEKYKELYDGLSSKTANYEELLSFKTEAETQWEKEVTDLESKLTQQDLTEYEIVKDGLSLQKKINYLKLKTSKQTDNINIDSTRSIGAGSGGNFPKTLAEMMAMPSSEVKIFKEKQPTEYKKLMLSFGKK
jgi:hypothetical protein